MPLDMQMMDAWRTKSNEAYQGLMLAHNAPGLFKKEYIDQLSDDLRTAEKHFNFWRGNG